MKKALLISFVGFVLGSILVLLLPAGARTQAPALQNGDFEGPFTVRDRPELVVASGWDYAYLEGHVMWCGGSCRAPEYKPETEIVAVEGTSQRWFVTYGEGFGTIHQRIQTEPGQWYRFACQVYAISEPDGQNAAMVGANPWGAGVFERTMIWGQQQPWGEYRQWHEVEVVFQAWGEAVRVAVGANNRWATQNNAVYVDECTFEKASGPSPTPEPCPTCTPGGECDYDTIRDLVREELDRTKLGH